MLSGPFTHAASLKTIDCVFVSLCLQSAIFGVAWPFGF